MLDVHGQTWHDFILTQDEASDIAIGVNDIDYNVDTSTELIDELARIYTDIQASTSLKEDRIPYDNTSLVEWNAYNISKLDNGRLCAMVQELKIQLRSDCKDLADSRDPQAHSELVDVIVDKLWDLPTAQLLSLSTIGGYSELPPLMGKTVANVEYRSGIIVNTRDALKAIKADSEWKDITGEVIATISSKLSQGFKIPQFRKYKRSNVGSDAIRDVSMHKGQVIIALDDIDVWFADASPGTGRNYMRTSMNSGDVMVLKSPGSTTIFISPDGSERAYMQLAW
jgi:hypothetical protein